MKLNAPFTVASKKEIEKRSLRVISNSLEDILKPETVISVPGKEYSLAISLINNEWLSIAYLKCLNDSPKSGRQIRREFKELVGDILCPHSQTFKSYVDTTLRKEGFTERVLTPRGIGWVSTEKRREIAPIMVYAIREAIKNKTSFYEILGKSRLYRGSLVGPCNRVRILELLSSKQKERITFEELAGTLKLHKRGLESHVNALARCRLIRYYTSEDKLYQYNGKKWKDLFLNEMNPKTKDCSVRRIAQLLHSSQMVMGAREIRNMVGGTEGLISYNLNRMARNGIIRTNMYSTDKSRMQITPEGLRYCAMFNKIKAHLSGKQALPSKPLSVKEIMGAAEIYLRISDCYKRANRPTSPFSDN